MAWTVNWHPDFVPEFEAFPQEVQDELLARLGLLEDRGPMLGRPTVDTLNGSSFANMKELRFKSEGGNWRFAFAFDTQREAIILVGGDKTGENKTKFYRDLIKVADERFAAHLATLRAIRVGEKP